MKKFPKNTVVLQPLQNSMIKVIYGLKKRIMLIWKISEKISRWCQSIKFQSTTHYWRLTISWDIHPMSKSTQNGLILLKRNIPWEEHITNNGLKVSGKPKLKCLGLTYNEAKLFNMLPLQMRENKNQNTSKIMTKDWIWNKIPSY